MIRLIIVEDSLVVRQCLSQVLSMQPDMIVTGEAANGLEAIDLLRSGISADVLLTDINMPDMDGIEMAEYVSQHFPENRVIILTMHARQEFIEKAQSAGAKAYILKDAEMDELFHVIRLVQEGETCFGPLV